MNFDPVAFALGPQGVAVATQGNSDGGGGASVAAAVVSSLIGEDTVTVEPLSVTANGTYTAPSGKAYSSVTVAVGGGVSFTRATSIVPPSIITVTVSAKEVTA